MQQVLRSKNPVLAGMGILFVLVSCGKTDRPEVGAGTPVSAAGGAAPQTGGAGSAPSAAGGSVGTSRGGEPQAAGGSQAGAPAECIEGAACNCGDLTGTLHCAESSEAEPSEAECSCPAAEVCQGEPRQCFEPCGGNPLGVWVLEQTCFNASSDGIGCAGAFIDAVPDADNLRLEILENEPLVSMGSEGLEVTAKVPLQCLGIESVERCSEVDFYASPLLYSLSRSLACQASECGHCECTARVGSSAGNGYSGSGKPWQPGSTTLAFGGMEVPYCVDGDTLWAGGMSADGTPKVAYQFRRKSCSGTPLPCAEREDDECAGDCTPGRCLPTADGDADTCADFAADQPQCDLTAGCGWDPEGCWGTASERCDFRNCIETPGCSWGPPQASCGGQIDNCFARSVASCSDTPGCAPRTCYNELMDDSAPCERLTTGAACSQAPGCTWNGTACSGVTRCGVQTDPDVCTSLDCFTSEVPICGGYPTQQCSDFGVDDCHTEPGCRLEW
jgi:hypothetical protein